MGATFEHVQSPILFLGKELCEFVSIFTRVLQKSPHVAVVVVVSLCCCCCCVVVAVVVLFLCFCCVVVGCFYVLMWL